MLNDAYVLGYIKDNLGFPFQKLEIDDQKILEYVKNHTIRLFSDYVPDKNKISMNLNSDSVKVPSMANEYYLRDPEGLDILSIIEIIGDGGDYFTLGHPYVGVLSGGPGLRDWALATETAMMGYQHSSLLKTWEFYPPNRFRISTGCVVNLDNVTVVYERLQPPDFRKIPTQHHRLFCDLALADIMIMIGRIRKKYSSGNLRTPFGEIPLEADIFDEGKDLKRELIDKMDRMFLPDVHIEIA